ncbi:MAG TPA: hypothetical protein VGG40_13205 [Solirubrobacterales bacterium]|jgi:hypothetical protein
MNAMTRGERNFLLVFAGLCVLTTVVVGVGLKLLGANDEVLSIGFLLVIAIGGLGGGWAFDRYTDPPEKR